MGIFSSLGSLVGMVMGGPAGSGVGSFLGNLLEGKGTDMALQSGIGALVTGGTMGQTGLLMNALQGAGGNQAVGNQAMNLFRGVGSPGGGSPGGGGQGSVGNPGTGTPYTGTGGIMQNMFTMPEDPLMNSLMREYLYKQRKPPDYANLLTPLQQKQLATGERAPDYRGTHAPVYKPVDRTLYANQGGYIQGPGTGTSDSIPAKIYQNGGPVQEARLSDGEFVMTEDAVRGAGNGDRAAGAAKMYQMMNSLERRA